MTNLYKPALTELTFYHYDTGEKIGTYFVNSKVAETYLYLACRDHEGIVKASFFGKVLPVPYNHSVYALEVQKSDFAFQICQPLFYL